MEIAPFSTWMREHPDANNADTEAEIALLFERQKAIAALVTGNLDAETLLDLLEYQGFDPTEYVEVVEDNLNFLCPGLT